MHGARNGIVNIIITREIHTLLYRDKSSIVQSARNIGKSSSFCGFAVGLAEMAHFSLVDHKANGTFAYRDQQRGQQEYEGCEPDKPTSAKQRRFSRPNTVDEIRLKRSKRRRRKRQEERKLSKKSLKKKFAEKYKINLEIVNNKHTKELIARSNQVHEYRKRAVHFWREWCKEKSKNQEDM